MTAGFSGAPERPQLLVQVVYAVMEMDAAAICLSPGLNGRHVCPAAKDVEVQSLSAALLVLSQQLQQLGVACPVP